jgi:OPA family glycerol-3-phosphate transporter-like MFS transporter
MTEKKRQNLLIFFCWLIYTVAYVGRYSFSANVNAIMDFYGTGKGETGLIGTFFFFAYGIGQIINGLLCKKYNKKYVLTIALIVSSIVNAIIFIGVPFWALKFLWLVNGIAQSFLWSSLISLISKNVSHSRLKVAVVVMSTSLAVGTFITYGLSALFNLFNGFKYSFLLGAGTMGVVAVLWLIFHDKLTLKADDFIEKEIELERKESEQKEKTGKTLAINFVVLFICLALFAVINNFIKDGLNTWVPTILKETYNLTNSLSVALTIILPVINLFGAMLSEWIYGKLKDFVTTLAVMSLFALVAIAIIIFTLKSVMIVTLITFAVVTLLMTGITHVIVSSAPVYMRSKMDAGLTSGVLDGFCYLGSTLSSYGLGAIAENAGWTNAFVIMLVACLVPVIVGVTLIIIQSVKKRKKSKSEN